MSNMGSQARLTAISAKAERALRAGTTRAIACNFFPDRSLCSLRRNFSDVELNSGGMTGSIITWYWIPLTSARVLRADLGSALTFIAN
jgi:hypothetical protein